MNTNFEGRKRRRRQAVVGDSPNYSGDIIVRNSGGNITERTVSYVIPQEALALAQDNNPDFSGQYSVVYFGQNLFTSDQNVSQVP